MKRKPNSIRAMRALRKQVQELTIRVNRAWVVDQEKEILVNIQLSDMERNYFKCADQLGYRVELRQRLDGKFAFFAVKRRDA